MNPGCAELQVFISLRAAGALEPAEEALVEAHLVACPGCRAEAARDAEVLGLARLPPPSGREHRALAGVPASAVAALRRAGARRGLWMRAAAVAAAIAAAAVMVAAPAYLRKRPPAPAPATAASTWQEPDLDTLWSDTEVLELEPVAASDGASSGEGSDAAFVALDAGEGG